MVIGLIVSLLAALGVNLAKKYCALRFPTGIEGSILFSMISCSTAAVVLLLWNGMGDCSAYTLYLGIVFGLITSLASIAGVLALQYGPLSYTTLIISFSTVITALSGALFFGESIGPSQAVGIFFMLLCFVFATEKAPDDEKKQANAKCILLSFLACFACGGIGVMQKIHQNSTHKDESDAFLIVSFTVATAISLILLLCLQRKKEKADNIVFSSTWQRVITVFILLGGGIGTALNNKLNLLLSGMMDSAVFFPIVNGGPLLLTTLSSFLIFKEKPTLRKCVGILLGILSVLLLCNPFG